MKIIFENSDEYETFVNTFCPASIGIEVEEDCNGECEYCLYHTDGLTLIKEYEEKENESSN